MYYQVVYKLILTKNDPLNQYDEVEVSHYRMERVI